MFPCRFTGEPFSVNDFRAVLDATAEADTRIDSVDTTA